MRKFFTVLFSALLCLAAASALQAVEEPLPGTLSSLHFDGIAYDEQNDAESIAIINGIALHQGDTYRGYKVAQISRDNMILTEVESGNIYELSPGDGQANVQKRENWIPKVRLPAPAPSSAPAASPAASGSWLAKTADDLKKSAQEVKDVVTNNPLQQSYNRTKVQIDKIKAENDARVAELNKIMDSMEHKS